ncbi:transglycosylase SLT domain-containing protein [Nocardia farcinica]|uniref:transglycosylase SLT domain-containing protein n=1 Tax=Nocardia farcinica TaxID=37329 RepID=UPI001E53B24D|nr:transglycosylase SLT domain-containing protein [Nocardia farcinica]
MPQYDAGSAGIKIKPNFRNFVTETEAELRRHDFRMEVRVGADTSSAAAEIGALQELARANQTFRMDADTRLAAAELAALQRVARENQTFRVGADTAAAAAEIEALRQLMREGWTIRPDVDGPSFARARGRVAGLGADLRRAGSVNLTVLGVIGAAGAIADLLAIADAAATAARTVSLIPAIGFGGLAGIASVATGMSGIPAAFKAMKSASDDAADSVTDQRDALEDVEEAQYRARAATRGLNDAYRDASRSIRDMNMDLDEQKLSVEDAAISVEEAGKRLMQVQFDPTADSTTRKRAQNSYDQAVLRLRQQQVATQDLAQDTAEANARGVEGSEQVAAARQAEASALRQLRDATEALNAPSGGQDKLNMALAELSPNARQMVTDIRSIGPAWTEARKASQDALTNGMGPAILVLADRQLPTLRDGLVGINTAINGGLRASLSALASDVNRVDFKTALDNTTVGFANAAKGAEPLTNAVTKLITVGSEFFPRFGTAIGDVAERFNDLIQRSAADGSLKKWMEEGIESTKTLGTILYNTGSAVRSLMRAAGNDGETLRSLDEITERMSRFLKSTEGQEELKEFFREARENMAELKPLLSDLPEILGGVYDGFQAWAGVVLPFLTVAGDLLADHPDLVRDVVIAYLAVKTIGPIFDAVRGSIAGAGTAMANFRQGYGSAAQSAAGSAGMLGGALGAMGPLGVAALTLGVGAGLTYLTQKHAEAEEAARKQQAAVNDLRGTLDQQTGAITQETIANTTQKLEETGYLERAAGLGVSPHTFVRAGLGLDEAGKKAINDHITAIILEQMPMKRESEFEFEQVRLQTKLTDTEIAQALQGIPEAVKKYTDAVQELKDKGIPVADLAMLKDTMTDVGESAATLGGEMNGQNTATAEAREAWQRINETLKGTFTLTEQGKQRFDEMGISVQSVPDEKTIVIKDTTPENLARIRELQYEIRNNLDGTLTLIANTEQARADIRQFTEQPVTMKVNVEIARFAGIEARGTVQLPARAEGGQLPTTGPGTERRDGILGVAAATGAPMTWLDGGEWVINRDSAARYDRELAAINAGTFPRMAEGGVVGGSAQALDDYARSLAGTPYGGEFDCSGLISKLANVAAGLPPDTGRMSTANEGQWLAALGWQTGKGGPGAFRVGWVNDPNMPGGGHTAGTLPSGVNVESNGSAGVVYGGSAAGYNHPMFNQWAFLQMQATGANTTGVGGIGTGDTSGVTTQQVLYAQAPLPGRRSDQELQRLQGEAAVDAANSERNAVYANPNSTDADKLAADLKYQQAQNSLEASQKTTGSESTPPSLQGIFSRAGSILATGLLSAFGLENSILSESNPYNRAIGTALDFYSQKNGQLQQPEYSYTPKNLPSTVTTTTPQSAAPSVYQTAPGDLGTLTIEGTVYNPDAGVEQWRPLATQALIKEGFNPAQVDIMLAQIQSESGGDPAIVQQVIDVNSGGNEAVGLLQVIPGTFATYRDPALPNDRTHPYANMVAALRYYRARYGMDLSTMWGQGHGYRDGGWAIGPGGPRDDGFLAPLSNGEFIVNADAAARNATLLEAINASSWSANRVDPNAFVAPTGATAAAGHDLSTTINARVADVDDLVELAERRAHAKAIGLMASLP